MKQILIKMSLKMSLTMMLKIKEDQNDSIDESDHNKFWKMKMKLLTMMMKKRLKLERRMKKSKSRVIKHDDPHETNNLSLTELKMLELMFLSLKSSFDD